jgi:hypothetical protein
MSTLHQTPSIDFVVSASAIGSPPRVPKYDTVTSSICSGSTPLMTLRASADALRRCD